MGLTIIASGSSEISMGAKSIPGYEKAIDPASMNLSVSPGDDFYEYAQGDWMKTHPVPADKSRYGEFTIVTDRNYEYIKEIVTSAANNTSAPEGSDEQKIGEFYRVGMDTAALEKQGLDPIKSQLDMIDNISSSSDLQAVSTQMLEFGINPFFSLTATPDKRDSKIMIATLSQEGLGLPDRDFYFMEDNESLKLREKYLIHISRMFVLLGDSPDLAEANARTVLRIETRLANASFNSIDDLDEVKTYNKMSLEELQAFAPGINWALLFSTLGQPDITEVNVRNPAFFRELSTALQEESVADWKTFLRWKLILASSPYLNSDLVKERFDFYGKTLSGQQEMRPRWKSVIGAENAAIGEVIGRIYVEKYFDPESKARMEKMVSNLKEVYGKRIQGLTWMEPETRKKALLKLEALDVQVGYPDEWMDYSDLEVNNDSYLGNMLRASKFQFYHGPTGVDKIGRPVNRKLWEMNPQETNAYADYNKIIMVFPAGILQPPFFNKDADDAVNYGAIGMVIGHEMTHHFDSQGRKFDENGNLTDWWTAEDGKNFNKSTEILVNEYNKFETVPGLFINGNLTLQENIADLGGLTMAYHAYKLSVEGHPESINGFVGDKRFFYIYKPLLVVTLPNMEAQVLEEFTDDQRFFLSYTQIWRESQTDEFLRMQTLADMHSPAKFRINGVVFNVPEFYNAFPDVKPEDKLYRSENERPVIW
ncbi:MAG: M13 family metallopeptidase [Methanosarcina sp.]